MIMIAVQYDERGPSLKPPPHPLCSDPDMNNEARSKFMTRSSRPTAWTLSWISALFPKKHFHCICEGGQYISLKFNWSSESLVLNCHFRVGNIFWFYQAQTEVINFWESSSSPLAIFVSPPILGWNNKILVCIQLCHYSNSVRLYSGTAVIFQWK